MKKQIYILIILFFYINISSGQEQGISVQEKWPSLQGHKFPSVNSLSSSFITTNLNANLGFGSTSFIHVTGIMIDDYEILSFEGKIMFFDMNVQYQQRITHWLALYISFKSAGRIGTDMSTIVADGVNTMSGGDIGWLINFMNKKKLNLSATIGLNNLRGNFINVSKFIEEVINNEPHPTVIKKVPALTAVVGIRGAYAFNSTFGLQFQTDYSYGESLERTSSRSFFTGGILGDIDFLPKYKFPLGLALGYTISSSAEFVLNEGGITNLFTGKMGYTGSSEFELGVQYTYYKTSISSVESDSFVSKILLNLKLYF